jgi:hypothetical protein
MSPEDKQLLEANVRRVVGVSALRRIRILVDESQQDDRKNAVIIRRTMYVTGIGAVLLAMLCFISPEVVMMAFRSVTALAR